MVSLAVVLFAPPLFLPSFCRPEPHPASFRHTIKTALFFVKNAKKVMKYAKKLSFCTNIKENFVNFIGLKNKRNYDRINT